VDDGFNYCIALYDYEATCPEELTFVENQVIKLVNKNPHDVDDGWWEGNLDGVTGLFPSLVVEECRPNGQPLTPEVNPERAHRVELNHVPLAEKIENSWQTGLEPGVSVFPAH